MNEEWFLEFWKCSTTVYAIGWGTVAFVSGIVTLAAYKARIIDLAGRHK